MSPGSRDKSDEDVKPLTPPQQQQQHHHQHQPHMQHQPFFATLPQHFANPGETLNSCGICRPLYRLVLSRFKQKLNFLQQLI